MIQEENEQRKEFMNLLNDFLTDTKTTIRQATTYDFELYLKNNFKDTTEEIRADVSKLFLEEKVRIKKRDKDYEKKRIKKTITFTSEEYKQLQKEIKKADVDFNKFAKSAILKKKIKLPIEQKLIIEISRIGNNLNQIARAVNGTAIEEDVITKLILIEKQIKLLSKSS